ncbi:MAG TPA: sigma-70 family RNA polymerase sigma factor [Solirubrobacteraceae bacterium]|nr:sigma-70 family RNA polymerase sigma factor [Solirubrobacteraceae bacterium]
MSVLATLPDEVAGARERFDELYRSSAGDVYAYVASLLRDRSAAEDVTALAFERAFRRRALLDLRRGTPRAWLFAIARNAALDELRRRRRVGAIVREIADESDFDDVDEVLAERRVLVREGLASLEPQDREIILLKFLGRLSNAELARVLRCSESNAGTRLHRAIERLREVCGVTR